ncbi:MAG: hypothetical protein ABIK68_23985 [bacterium]
MYLFGSVGVKSLVLLSRQRSTADEDDRRSMEISLPTDLLEVAA